MIGSLNYCEPLLVVAVAGMIIWMLCNYLQNKEIKELKSKLKKLK